jgi:hypothetical protein
MKMSKFKARKVNLLINNLTGSVLIEVNAMIQSLPAGSGVTLYPYFYLLYTYK